MLWTRLYYQFKRYMPGWLRLFLRRIYARRILRTSENVWPIQESAGKRPHDWPGWPENKQFAFVLTHDVEGWEGLERCLDLARLETRLGFRSSFNFIPEGSYQVPQTLLDWLPENGFEVGVHDLHHDGKLFRNRDGFRRKAKRINHHLQAWKAVGFRSGFMLRNLEWIPDLEIEYDASTFDTDPFEPQPEGGETIFPHWVANPNARAGQRPGYVELPYTLPQDSTLFVLFQHRDIDIWIRKLEWIAARGGMALMNVHPDYLNFDGRARRGKFPAQHFERFLQHVAENYGQTAWCALPREVARHVAGAQRSAQDCFTG